MTLSEWLVALPMTAIVYAAYHLGKEQERGRCERIALTEAGRAKLHEEARMASRIAGIISKDLPIPRAENSDEVKRCRKCQVPLRRVGDDNLTGMHCESCLRSESVRNRLDALAEKVATFVPREGLIIRGWFCETCRVFNGEEKEPLTACRSCARPRTCRGCEGLHGHAGPCVWPRNEIERVEREAFSLMSDANELDTCACGESTCIHCQKVPQ